MDVCDKEIVVCKNRAAVQRHIRHTQAEYAQEPETCAGHETRHSSEKLVDNVGYRFVVAEEMRQKVHDTKAECYGLKEVNFIVPIAKAAEELLLLINLRIH